MGSDSGTIADDSCKKHRRSTDGETEETTKRRKHKHHHQRHHRHHHRSKKRDEGERVDEEEVEMEVDELPTVVADLKKDYDDMEEGEIVEEDGEKLETNHLLAVDSPDSTCSLQGQMNETHGDGNKMSKVMGNDQISLRDSVHGNDVVTISDSSDDKCKRPVCSPHQNRGHDELRFIRSSGSYHPLDRSGSQPRSDVENMDSLKIAQLQGCDYESKRKYADESDDEVSFRHDDSEQLRASRSKALEEEREPSVNYSRHADRQDRKAAKDISRKYLDDGEVDLVHRHQGERGSSRDEEKERKKSRTRDHEKERSRGTGREVDREMDQDVDEKTLNGTEYEMTHYMDRKPGREREKDTDTDQHRGKVTANDKIIRKSSERDRRRDTEVVDRHRESERDQYIINEREKDRKRHRSADRARDRDISSDRARDRKKGGNDSESKRKDWFTERDRENERPRDRSDERVKDRRREGSDREREGRRDRSRDRYWDAGHHKYSDASGKQDRHSEYKRDGNSRSHDHDKRKNDDTSRLDRSINSAGYSEDARKREEEEHEEYEEKISMQLAEEEEEDDVERIKEESRRRRQAILEKYKNMKLQDQSDPQSGNDQEKLSILHKEQLSSISEVANDKSGNSLDVAKSPVENGESAAKHTVTRGLGEGTPKSERSDDMFCDDIFGETPTRVRKSGKGDELPVIRSGLHDNWDDAEGYYSYRFGELLDGRYEITAAHGKGVFSSVVRAKDLKAGPGEPEEVAIKIIRNNETMYKAGQSELIILKKLVGADPEDRRHCVRFLSSFKYRNHLCLVFESLHMNLREVLKKFGRNIGLKLTAVRAYAKQLLIALKHLRNCGVLHCDIKPDNMLVNESKNVLKLCDFGNAMFAGKNEITPYLVSRFYRAPEIILGLTYDHPVDIWSIGCCLYELYTGKVLFPGATNNDMLRLHLELKGSFPKKMLRKGAFTEQHFDQDLNFLSLEDDPVTKKTTKRVLVNIKPKDIGSIITGSAGEDPKMLTNFKDLLDKIFTLDLDKRMTVSQALAHPFITGHLPGTMATHQCLDALKSHQEKALEVEG